MEKPTILQLSNIYKYYRTSTQGQRIEILKGLNFELKKGETASIMGKSGSGKSTLLSITGGLDTVDEGQVVVSGQNISSMNEQQLTKFRAENISIIFQQFHLIAHLSALDNVRLPLQILGKTQNLEQRATEALQQVQLLHRASHLPHQLSGGEQQRLAIARALVVKPAVLLADEPTGNLDEETGYEVLTQLFNVVSKNNITMLLVTHDETLAKKCDSVYKLNGGMLEKYNNSRRKTSAKKPAGKKSSAKKTLTKTNAARKKHIPTKKLA